MLKYKVEGYFNKRQCEVLKEKLQGATYMNFDIQYGGCGNQNQQIIVCSSNTDYTDEELKEMFLYCLINELTMNGNN